MLRGTPKAAVAVPACGEDSEGPLLLEAAAGPYAPRQRWGDGYDDEAGRMADVHIGTAEQVANLAAGVEFPALDPVSLVLQGLHSLGIEYPRSISDPARGRAEWLPFVVGDPVELHGLSAVHGLNGKRGTVESLVVETSRIAVRLDSGGGLKSVKPTNVRLDV